MLPPNKASPPPPTAFTEKDRDLKLGMNVHHEGHRGDFRISTELSSWRKKTLGVKMKVTPISTRIELEFQNSTRRDGPRKSLGVTTHAQLYFPTMLSGL